MLIFVQGDTYECSVGDNNLYPLPNVPLYNSAHSTHLESVQAQRAVISHLRVVIGLLPVRYYSTCVYTGPLYKLLHVCSTLRAS